jgi:glycosyltransferase involved in cell wall biosynthesis
VKPTFSIVMPSYLGEYPGAAKYRHTKFIRAVQSVIDQTFKDWELIIVADGCQETVDLFRANFAEEPRAVLLSIKRSELWCPGVRNVGITESRGQFIAYLDTDDKFGPNHLSKVLAGIENMPDDSQWWYHDTLWWRKGEFYIKRTDIKRCSGYGTANIVHRNNGYLWPTQPRKNGVLDYGTQDCAFVDTLKKVHVPLGIGPAEYYVCHTPPQVLGAYDV